MNQPIFFIMNISYINYQEQCVYIWHSQKREQEVESISCGRENSRDMAAVFKYLKGCHDEERLDLF